MSEPSWLDDPDSNSAGVPNFADDASFGGSGDDYVVTGSGGEPLLANTGNAADWVRDTLAGRSSVDDEDYGGTFDQPTQNGNEVDINFPTGDGSGSGSTMSGQAAFSRQQLEDAISSLPSSNASSGLLSGGLLWVIGGLAAVAVVLSLGDDRSG